MALHELITFWRGSVPCKYPYMGRHSDPLVWTTYVWRVASAESEHLPRAISNNEISDMA